MKEALAIKPEPKRQLLIFDTHPIQYRAPVFRKLYHRYPNLKVYFSEEQFNSKRWWFHEVGKIPKQDWDLPLTQGYPNEIIKRPVAGIIGFMRAVSKILYRENPIAIIIYGYYLPEHWALWWLAHYYKAKIIFVGETMLYPSTTIREGIKSLVLPMFFRGVSQFISIGNRSLEFYESHAIESERITKAKYCIDTHFFDLSPEKALKERELIRNKLNIPMGAFVSLFVGRLFDRKRPNDIFEIHSQINNENYHSIIAGNGPMENTLMEKAKSTRRVHMVGFQNQEEIRSLYYASDLLIVPSVYETWGLIVNEAAVTGLASLVSDQCGAAFDLVIPEKTGSVFRVGDLKEASDQVRRCMSHGLLAKKWGQAAKRLVLSQYNVEQFSDAVLKAVQKITNTCDQ